MLIVKVSHDSAAVRSTVTVLPPRSWRRRSSRRKRQPRAVKPLHGRHEFPEERVHPHQHAWRRFDSIRRRPLHEPGLRRGRASRIGKSVAAMVESSRHVSFTEPIDRFGPAFSWNGTAIHERRMTKRPRPARNTARTTRPRPSSAGMALTSAGATTNPVMLPEPACDGSSVTVRASFVPSPSAS